MWHEGSGSRGASEIGSCIFNFIQDKVEHGVNAITAFCDSCGGQNRNFKVASLMSHCVSSMEINSFTLHFIRSGHLYPPNDADFGVIERAKKTGKDIYVPKDWMEVVRKARSRKPFKLIEMKPQNFADLGALSKLLVNRKKADDGTQVK